MTIARGLSVFARWLSGFNTIHNSARYFAALLVLLAIAPTGFSQVYKYVDEHGNITYSDSPPEGKEDMAPADLPDIIVQPAVKVPKIPTQGPALEVAPINVSIVSPENDMTVPPGQTSLNVSARLSRELVDGETLILLANGEEAGRSRTPNWTLNELYRGELQLVVQVIDSEGKQLSASEAVVAHIKRASVLNR